MIKVKINDREYLVHKKDEVYYIDDDPIHIDLYKRSNDDFHILHEGRSLNLKILRQHPEKKEIEMRIGSKVFTGKIVSEKDSIIERIKALSGNDSLHQKVVSPMPGLVQKIFVAEGDSVAAGDPLLILNAMKMENILKSPADGKISGVSIKEGEQVEKGRVLIQF